MSKEYKVYCDSCKKDVGFEVYTLEKHAVNAKMIMGDNRTPFDLCKDCFDFLCHQINVESFKDFPKFTNS